MRMEQYMLHTNHNLWDIVVNGNTPVAVAAAGASGKVPPKTAKELQQKKNELQAKSTLLLGIPDEHLMKFHGIQDAKSLWGAIKARFGGNKESKKMQKAVMNQLEIHGEKISHEDVNMKLLRSLPLTWNTHALIIRNKGDLETVSTYDLYHNLKVYEAKNTSSTNETVNTADNTASTHDQASPSPSTYADEVMCSFFATQSNTPQLDSEDLEQIDADDLEEMDIKWQVAMLTMRVKKFMKKTRRNFKHNGKETVGFDKTKVECYNCHKRGHFARECRAPRNQGNRNGENARRTILVETSATALIVQDVVGGYDWSFQDEEASINFALMAYLSPSSSSSLDSEVHTCLKECLKSFETLQKQYDEQKEKLNRASLEIIGYQIGLESVEARLLVHVKNEAAYEESIDFLNYDVRVRDAEIKQLKNQLDEALKEKDDLKLKSQKFDTSSKNLTKLINSQISVNDNSGLGYDSQFNESEVVNSVSNNRDSNVDDNPVNDRFKTVEGIHAVPPPYIGNYFSSRADLSFARLDDFVYRSDMSKSKANETRVKPNETVVMPIEAETNKVELKSVPESVVNKSRVFNYDPIIEEWDSGSDEDEIVLKSVNEKHTNEKAKQPRKFSQSPRNDKKNWNERMTQKLGLCFGFTKQAYFVYGSLNHLIRDCNYHENKMVKKSVMNNVFPLPLELFKIPDENQVVLRIPRNNNMYNIDLKNIVPTGGLTCLVAKALFNESNLWRMRHGHINLKTLNKLVKGNLIRGLPSKTFENDHSCVACQKGKQHKASWVYRNKTDKRGIAVKNKARLVAQGDTQEEGIDYDEVFAPVSRIKAIKLFLAYASFIRFIVYQMDVKSAFLYGTIEEEVYVCQPPGFEDPQFPDKVYKVEKALYGLHQVPRAWYETLSTYLLENRFRKGTIDKTLFIKKDKGDILLVQCKKHTIIALSTTEAEYVAAANCRGQIVDFLAGSHIRYALTANPTIYVSLIEQFWQTVTVETVNDREQQLTVTVDGQTIAITEASA
ncbi:ribonuclease H-like domain-containing protein [Tanacetum coccineum]